MHRRVFSKLFGIGLLGLALSVPSANADTILVFGQNGLTDTVTATNNGKTGVNGGTMLTVHEAEVTITAIGAPLATPLTAYFSLTATSDSNAVLDSSGHVNQDFSGSFTLTQNANGTGTNYLSGTFVGDVGASGATVFGSGTSLTFSASDPSGIPSLTSSVIGELLDPRGMSLAFTDVTPSARITANDTIGAFKSNLSGNFSASAVPEPSSLVLSCISVLGLVGYTWRRKASINGGRRVA
jgi:hypothetical protein